MPSQWKALWEMLPSQNVGSSGSEPELPLILSAWHDTPALVKIMRLKEHIEWAEKYGVLDKVDTFLRSLKESQWLHLDA